MSNKIVFVFKLQGQKFLVSPIYTKKDWIKDRRDSYKTHLQEIFSIMDSHALTEEGFQKGIEQVNLFYDITDTEIRTKALLDDMGCCTFFLYSDKFIGKRMEILTNDFEVESYITRQLSWKHRADYTTVFTEEGTLITIKKNSQKMYECSFKPSDNASLKITSGFDLMRCLKTLTAELNSSNKRNMYYCYEKGEDLYAY